MTPLAAAFARPSAWLPLTRRESNGRAPRPVARAVTSAAMNTVATSAPDTLEVNLSWRENPNRASVATPMRCALGTPMLEAEKEA
jgi:hypothetical protein